MAVHDPDFSILKYLIPDEAVVLDVGANRGQSIESIKTVRPRATIHSFEPNPEFRDALTNIAASYDGVTVNLCGLGAQAGTMTFFVPCAGGVRYLEEVTMVPDEFEKPG